MASLKTWWMISIVCLLVIPSLQATTGCFLDEESPYYCEDLDQTQAQQECELSDDCDFAKLFTPDQTCETNPDCEEIICKDTCTPLYAGICSSGPISPQEQDQWCSPGCCRIHYEGGNVCNYFPNKGLCEAEAQSWEASAFNYDSTMDQASCESYCAPLRSLTADPFQHLPKEKTSVQEEQKDNKADNGEEPANIPSKNPPIPDQGNVSTSTKTSNDLKKESSTNLVLPLIITALAGVAFFLFARMRRSKTQTDQEVPTQESQDIDIPDPNSEIDAQRSLKPSPVTIRAQPTQKQEREKEKTSLYLAFGVPQKKLSGPLKTLDRLVKTHQKTQTQNAPPNTFDRLRSLSKKK